MLKFLLVALLAVAVSATGEEHDAAIAEVAQEMVCLPRLALPLRSLS
jgi:hypothetical protein